MTTQEEMVGLLVFLVLLANVNYVTAQTDPTSITCSAVNTTSLRLSWTSATSASVVGYHLEIQRVDGLKVEPAIPTVTLANPTYNAYEYNGLGKYGTYSITIHSYTASNNLTDYATNCTTSEDVPDSAPQKFICTAYSTTAINCSWDALEQQYWNGILLGYQLQWFGSNVTTKNEANVSTATIDYSFTGLYYDHQYIFLLNGHTSIGYSPLYATAIEKTFGAPEPEVENKTKYYCYEAVPGMIEFGWDEMPCTIYMGTIAGLFTLCTIFIGIFACQACCSKAAKPSQIEINIDNTDDRSRGYNGHDDDRGSSEEDLQEDSEDDHSSETDEDDIEQTAGARKKSMESTLSQNGNIPSPAPLNAGSATPSSAVGENGVDHDHGETSDSDYHTDIEDEEAAIGLTHLSTKTGIVKAAKANKVKSSDKTQSKKSRNVVSKTKEKSTEKEKNKSHSGAKEKKKLRFGVLVTSDNNNESDEESSEDEDYEDWDPELTPSANADVTYVQEQNTQARKTKKRAKSKRLTTSSKSGTLTTENKRKLSRISETNSENRTNVSRISETNSENRTNVSRISETNSENRTNVSRISETNSRNDWDDEWTDEPSLSDKSGHQYDNSSVKGITNSNKKDYGVNNSTHSNTYNNNNDRHSHYNASSNDGNISKNKAGNQETVRTFSEWDDDDDDIVINDTTYAYVDETNISRTGDKSINAHFVGHMVGGNMSARTHAEGDTSMPDGQRLININEHHSDGVTKTTFVPKNAMKHTTIPAYASSHVTENETSDWDDENSINENSAAKMRNVTAGHELNQDDRMAMNGKYDTGISSGKMAVKSGPMQNEKEHNQIVIPENRKVHMTGAIPKTTTLAANGKAIDTGKTKVPENGINTGLAAHELNQDDRMTMNGKYDTGIKKYKNAPANTVHVTGVHNTKNYSSVNANQHEIDNPITTGTNISGSHETQHANGKIATSNSKGTHVNSAGAIVSFSDTHYNPSLTSKGVNKIMVKGHNSTEAFDGTNEKYTSGQSAGGNGPIDKQSKISQQSNFDRTQNSRENFENIKANKGPYIKGNSGTIKGDSSKGKHDIDVHTANLNRNTNVGPNNISGRDNRKTNTNAPEHGIDVVHVLEVQPELDPRKKRNPSTLHPAWATEKQNDRQVKSGRRNSTPVKSIRPERRNTVTEAEPVLGTDRLGKKFPFLNANIDNINENRDPSPSNINGWIKKNQSEPNLESMSHKAAAAFAPSGPSSKMPKSASTSNIEDMNQDKSKVFYGFGVGRFRQLASSWVRKWRMKKKPPKTGLSEWN